MMQTTVANSSIESLLTANEIRVMDRSGTVIKERLEQQCILPKQYEQITKALYDCQNLLGAWVKSDNKRYVDMKIWFLREMEEEHEEKMA